MDRWRVKCAVLAREVLMRVLPLAILISAFTSLSFGQSQGSATPVPDPDTQFAVWQTNQTTATTLNDTETHFKIWQHQRTSADSINLFKCTTSTDLDNPECVGRLPGVKKAGTKEATTPTSLPLSAEKTGPPDCPGLAGKSRTICSGDGGELVKPATVVRDKSGNSSAPK